MEIDNAGVWLGCGVGVVANFDVLVAFVDELVVVSGDREGLLLGGNEDGEEAVAEAADVVLVPGGPDDVGDDLLEQVHVQIICI